MESQLEHVNSWRAITSLADAREMVDIGSLLKWKDMRVVKKVLSNEDVIDLVKYFAIRLAERVQTRLSEEILIESLMIVMANFSEEKVLNAFLEELLQQPNRMDACFVLVELALTAEISDQEHVNEIFSFAVALVCELGGLLQEVERDYPGELGDRIHKLLEHISTFLLSVSNSSNNCIRLSLLAYFSSLERGLSHKPSFNRIMARFGHTILEHLFALLFFDKKKTEGVALQFLLENIPTILEADNEAQRILHETWKYYMLKKPERFGLFIQTLSSHLLSLEDDQITTARKVFMQHLGVLLRIVSEVNHKDLAREIIRALAFFESESFRGELLGQLIQDSSIRDNFKKHLIKLKDNKSPEQVMNEFDGLRSSKRGRKPSFAKVGKTRPIYQATFLGHQPTTARVS